MDWENAAKAAVAALAVVAGGLRLWRNRAHPRESVRRDLEILKSLPEDSQARDRLRDHIDRSLLESIKGEEVLRRDPTGIVLALLFIGAGVAGIYYGVQTDGIVRWLLWVAALFMLLLGVAGLTQDAVKRERDARGRPVS